MEFTKPGTVLFGARPLLYAKSAKFSIESDDKEVKTLALGLAGFSDGAQSCKLSGDFAIPSTGQEVDWPSLAATHTTVDLGYKVAGKTYQMRGRVMSAEIDTSTDNPTLSTFSFSGFITAIL